jgi:electron transfer flavoprotein beta subunit
MGPMNAAEILRESLFRGADRTILLSDRKFAGADTQATSYTLAHAVKKVGKYDLIFCGRQAIDGDTAQVGPQTAAKLDLPQITYAESILEIKDGHVVVQRAFDLGTELVKCSLPCLLTVVGTANRPRPASVRLRIAKKMAGVPSETPKLLEKYPEFGSAEALQAYLAERGLEMTVWTAADLDVDEAQLGLGGSPTQVHKVNYVVLEATESKEVPATPEGISALIEELIREYVVG